LSFDGNQYPSDEGLDLTTKGQIHTHDTSANAALNVGSNTYLLTADSTETTGMKWAAGALAPTTTKGDISGFSTTQARIPVGTNNYSLFADSAQALGLKWAASPTSTLTTTGDLLASSAPNVLTRIAGGASGELLTGNGAGVLPTFQAAAAGGGGKLTLISRLEVSSGTDIDISFTSESGDNISSLVCYYDIQRTNVGTCDVLLQYGAGSLVTSAYYTQQIQVSNSTNVTYSNQAEWLLARNPNYRHFAGMAQIYIGDSDQTSSNSDIIFTGNSTNTNPEGYLTAGTRDGTENSIDQVKLSIDAGALVAGSVLTLYSVDNS
jgi:hypothetical protein